MRDYHKLLDKTESLVLLTQKASTYWSFIKFVLQIPLILTSSAMCIINSISEDPATMKIPNVVVNGVSVLIMSITSNVKASEKFEKFKRLSQNFMTLAQEIEALEGDINNENYKLVLLKYDNLIQDVSFEDIPQRFKKQVADLFTKHNRYIPININGSVGNLASRSTSRSNVFLEPV